MALNLSTLTSPATSGDVIQEIDTTADFLEGVPLLKNLARGSQAGGSAKQDVALNQPRALPLIKNTQGKLGGYLYIPNASGNYATGPGVTIGANQTWEAEVDMVITKFEDHIIPFGAGPWNAPSSSTTPGFGLFFANNANVYVFSKAVYGSALSGVVLGQPFTVKYGFDGTNVFCDINAVRKVTQTATGQSGSITHPLQIAQQAGISHAGNYAIQKAKLTVNNAVVFDCDFNGSTSIRHGDTKFNCVGGPVSLIKAGQDPVTVVKKNILRFDGADDFMDGVFGQTITDGYMFAAFSVLGDGGNSYARVFSMNSTGGRDNQAGGFAVYRNSTTNNFLQNYNGFAGSFGSGLFDDAMGDVLIESDFKNSSQIIKVNNADKTTHTTSGVLSAEEFKISAFATGGFNAAIDLEFLALFSVDSVPDEATAKRIRDYINGRGVHGIYLRHQTDGYYFYDATRAPSGAISSGSSAWSGRIVGSDNGDSASLLATQSTSNDAPVSDGYTVTFADNTDHLDIPSISQAGYQICGTSLGTFVYKINGTTAVTELNLLGNLGHASYRKAGDLYGIILLPESATSADIESARRLLIDRGAADGATAVNYFAAWVNRSDIVEFKNVEFGSVINFGSAWEANSFSSFPLINASSGTYFAAAWFNCTSLNDFAPIQATLGNNFSNAWKSCTALTSFPAGAKLGTEANNVNFSSAWQSSGLTSFELDLSTGTSFTNTFRSSALTSFGGCDLSKGVSFKNFFYLCSNLTEISADAKFGTAAVNVDFDSAFNSTGLTAFPALDLSNGRYFAFTFQNCTSLIDFSPRVFNNWNPSSITNGVFNKTFYGCSALSANSVENILTSIAASGQYATVDGNSGSAAIADAAIDIDYNAASGSLSAATNTAVSALKGRGWSIVVNNVTL